MLNDELFSIFRQEHYPTFYKYNGLPKFWIDINLFRLVSLFIAILLAFLIILPGFRAKKFSVALRWSTSLIILFLMLFCNLMPYWERGQIRSQMPYRFGRNLNIDATVGINIGLRGINITLIGNPINQHNDTIDFNEYFDWTWSQGKPGFGYDAGKFQKDYRHAQFRGLPYPILWIAETFTIDYESIHIGRYYRQAGWLYHYLSYNILFQTVIYYGSLWIIFTGISLLSANFIVIFYSHCSIPLTLAFDNGFLITHYSWCFYINLINGILCIIIGIITLIADLRLPDETAEFFGNDVLQSYEDYFADPQDNDDVNEFNNIHSTSDNEVLLRRKQINGEKVITHQEKTIEGGVTRGLKKRTLSNRFSRFQKSTIRSVKKPNTTSNDRHRFHDEHNTINQIDLDDVGGDTGVVGVSVTNVNLSNIDDKQSDEIPLYENFRQFSTIGEEKEDDNEM
uniref:LOW QUALITY PROTEIN: dual oxidase maturation factor 1-like n=1 Tax=Dermatophagoides pteronyssinus TaxID=6956 RepID=A0A6P6Y1T4_DERPT|nr:LOW QUALITY PROTEIN: dual oxidase maturation factor 1-like [Dermatophagoides pteronyssinus]